jgi:hypothetical protein
VRSLPGTQRLRALVVFDEVYGFLPPHVAGCLDPPRVGDSRGWFLMRDAHAEQGLLFMQPRWTMSVYAWPHDTQRDPQGARAL